MTGSRLWPAGQPDCTGGLAMAQPPDEQGGERSRSAAVIGLIVVLALVVAAVYLVRALRNESQLEDCLMSGRTNCAPIEAPSGGR
jgi:hypothetical protein